MIDVHDLMCGNWLYDTVLKKAVVFNNLPYGIDMTHREGIPVTEELLEKIGFKKHQILGDRFFWRYWGAEYRYKLDVDFDFCNSDRKFSIHIDNGDCETIGCGEFTYVHELQNLVRINCKADLPITKEVFDGLGNES